MGNRACVVFFDRTRVSPTVYLHWHGDAVPAWLDQLKDRMNGRFSDAAYAAARFVGICHANIDGNLSLGISSNDLSLADVQSKDRMEDAKPRKCGHRRGRYQRFQLEGLWRLPGRERKEAAMTLSNQERADRCQQAITAYSDDDTYTNLVDFLADAMHWCDLHGHSFRDALDTARCISMPK